MPHPPRLLLPRPPDPPPPHSFPVLATLVPVVGALILWAATSSPTALLFGALGPLVAVASVADSRLQARRGRRREMERFDSECAAVERGIARAHRAEREAIESRVAASFVPSPHWRRGDAGLVTLRLGWADRPSVLELVGEAPGEGAEERRLATLRRIAGELRDAPVLAELSGGIGLVGDAAAARSVARDLALQLARLLHPRDARLELRARDPTQWRWLESLPHDVEVTGGVRDPVAELSVVGDEEQIVAIVIADRVARLPATVGVIADIGADGRATLLEHPDHAGHRPLETQGLTLAQAASCALDLAREARAHSVAGGAGRLASFVAFAELAADHAEDDVRQSLRAPVGVTAEGRMTLDLARQGPHAVVGGMTGSGKSELLLSWLLGIAARRSPLEACFLAVDFKGGATFDALRRLPHCVGVVTDLAPTEAARALASLRAELRRRETLLAAAGLRSIDEAAGATPFPRLIVVVDEYASLAAHSPELAGLFTDLASRGRSLGIHLILCTQRASGVIRESVLANCGLRLSLRVTDESDSRAVVGTDAAARLPARPAGRAVVAIAGEPPRRFQVAHSVPADVDRIAERWSGHALPRQPWCPALPPLVNLAAIPPSATGIAIGLVDLPEQQRQETFDYDPLRHGSLLVVGGPRSGKTNLIEIMLARAGERACALIRADPVALWDELHDALRPDRAASPTRLVLIDDLDVALTAVDDDYAAVLLELARRVVREGPARGIHLVMTVQSVPAALHGVAALCASRLLLRLSDRQEYLAAGGDSSNWQETLPAGGGVLHGNRVQLALGDERLERPAGRAAAYVTVDPATEPRLAVVSTAPSTTARLLSAAGRPVVTLTPMEPPGEHSGADARSIVIADPETWQAQWMAFAAAKARGAVLFHGCSPADVRALTRSRRLPPLAPPGERALWLLRPEGELQRARLTAAPIPLDQASAEPRDS